MITPWGRIMFGPAFVVRAALDRQAKLDQDTRLNPSPRRPLIDQLNRLENAFSTEEKKVKE